MALLWFSMVHRNIYPRAFHHSNSPEDEREHASEREYDQDDRPAGNDSDGLSPPDERPCGGFATS